MNIYEIRFDSKVNSISIQFNMDYFSKFKEGEGSNGNLNLSGIKI